MEEVLEKIAEAGGPASSPTLYRWMKKHPKLEVADPKSTLGHPFPQPISYEQKTPKMKKQPVWNERSVLRWIEDNHDYISRHPRAGKRVEMRAIDVEYAKENADPSFDPTPIKIEHFEDTDEFVICHFKSDSDAVRYKLRFYGAAPEPEEPSGGD